MIFYRIRKRLATGLGTSLLILTTPQFAFAAPGPLATAPLFLSTIVEPNVFFTLDNSGSMGWVNMVENGTGGFTASNGLPLVGASFRYFYHPDWYSDNRVLPPRAVKKSWAGNLWILRNHNGNKNYYNPDVAYTPWAGVKADGTPMYPNANPTSALRNPNKPNGQSTDLTQKFDYVDRDDCKCTLLGAIYLPTYSVWNDTDVDGVIEAGDAHTIVEIPASDTIAMQNFANWFVYYRTREFAAKAAIGRVINNTEVTRMGLDVFNGGHKKDMESMTNITKKRELLTTFYDINSRGGTPARRSLQRVGKFFKSTNIKAPILSAANGGECQQNFNILMTDGFWNGKTPAPRIGNADQSSDNIGFDGDADESNDGGNYEDTYSDTLADVAMHYYETDLRPNIANKNPVTVGVDEATHQHLVSYTISFGLNGTKDSTTVSPLDPGFTWPDAYAGDAERVDDLWHAAYNGRGKYLSAQNPAELEASLNAAISDIAARTATAAAVSVNSAKLSTESVVYLAEFNSNRWQGDLSAFKIVDLNTGALSKTPVWTAATELNSRNIAANPRVILTNDGNDGVSFQWGNLSTAQQSDLKTGPAGNIDTDTVAIARLNYLRGDRTDEGFGNFFRERASLLGDLVNSGPVFVGAPALRWPDTAPFPNTAGTRYSDFKSGSVNNRDGVIYAGANDGMLHGFSETTGSELVAYIPNNLFSSATSQGLHFLTDQNYTHKYYNDLTPTISDIYSDLGGGNQWHTVLISGQRGGGRGLFALDVTNPNDFYERNANKLVLWEFTSDDDPDLGFTYSKPQVGMTNDGSWVAIFGNGYSDTGDGKAKLFILKIKEGIDGNWSGGFIKINTGSGSTTDRNGLATPALADLDGNGTIDRVYAGDLKGQMWAFDLSTSSSTGWGIANGSSPLFTTKGNEPITAQAALARHPTISRNATNSPNIMVFFGSGQYLVNSDKASTAVNHFYGVWDRNITNLNDSQLVEQTYDTSFSARVLTRNAIDYIGGEFGWFFKLPDTGERSVRSPAIRGDVVFFNTFVPSADPCSVGGYSYRFAVGIATGGSPLNTAMDTNGDSSIDDADTISNGLTTENIAAIKEDGVLTEDVFVEDLAFSPKPFKVPPLDNIPIGRLSWRELIQ